MPANQARTFRMAGPVWDEFERLCAQEGIGTSEGIRRAIQEWVLRHSKR